MSVSAVGSDLDAILGSNEDFQKRLANMRDAQTTLEQAQTNLNLGKDAKAALEEAQRVKLAAERDRTEEYNRLQAEMQRGRDDLARMVAEARAAADDRSKRAQESLAAADQKQAAAQSANESAQALLAAAEVNSAKTLADAQASADALLNEAKQKSKMMTDEAARLSAEAQASLNTAASQKAEWEAKVAKLKAAIG